MKEDTNYTQEYVDMLKSEIEKFSKALVESKKAWLDVYEKSHEHIVENIKLKTDYELRDKEFNDKIIACQHVLTNMRYMIGDRKTDYIGNWLREETYGFDPYLNLKQLNYVLNLIKKEGDTI